MLFVVNFMRLLCFCCAFVGRAVRVYIRYPWLEQMLGFGFVATAVAMIFVLPLSWTAAQISFFYKVIF